MLIESIEKEFVADKKFEGLTENSLTSYHVLFRNFNSFLTEQGIEQLEDVSGRTIKAYLHWNAERGNKARSINSKLKLIRAFCRWLHEESLTETLLTKGIKSLKQDENPKIVKTEDVRAALSYLRRIKRREDTFTARRNYAIIVFFVGTGLRIGEVERLNWADINFEESLIMLNLTKSRKAQSVPLSEELARELLDWRLYLEKKFEKLPAPLFVTREGIRLTRTGMQNFFKRLKKNAGITGTFSPHALRAYFIKSLLQKGGNLREVQLLARHSKITVTQLYIGYFQSELKDAIDEHNPLGGLI
ncbi:tyrosine-type recombinase/integrase [Sporolactobacillus terrae]|uniref:Recombinase XerD n=1 Tax=Sporolactobacillus terrae TaxID=269673 RepID=A0A5K7WTM8_9BACL|nr:tyrosine-type recombinase/integrase [Sporolactobacillus terrae]BBN98041.1 recombinase XerD [Sporolactobacillus terrae]